MADLTFGALVPAAGLSSRMEEFKPLITVGGQTVIERVVNLFKTVGVDEVVAVIGHRGDELIPVLEQNSARWVINPGYREEMITSIQVGAKELRGRCDAFFILPVDIPLVRPPTIRHLMDRFGDRRALVCHPVFATSRGHPPLMASSLIDKLLAWQGTGGLKVFLETYADHSADIPVADAWMRRDIDTDEALAALSRDFERYTIPTREECDAMLSHYLDVPERIQTHGRTVADVAYRLGQALNTAGGHLDLTLLTAASLLHDSFKGEMDHAGQAAAWLEGNGFPEVAYVVGAHMDLPWEAGDALDEKALLYLADKIVEGERVVTVAERRAGLLERYGHDEEARRNIERRLETAEKIQAAVQKITDRSLAEILSASMKR